MSRPDFASSLGNGADTIAVHALAGFTRLTGGGVPGTDRPAYTLLTPQQRAMPVVISVPHAGRIYPPDVLARMRDPARASLMLEDRHADQIGLAIAQDTGATLLVADAPRAMLDLNRAPEDVDWAMIANGTGAKTLHSAANCRARSGLGLVPRRLARLGEIWKSPLEHHELEDRIASIHSPYHVALSQTLAAMRDQWGAVMLIDLHSMPPITSPIGAGGRPHLVIGDRFGASCRADLTGYALTYLGRNRAVAHNLPYSGGYILDRHGAPKQSIHALQLEVCRSTYLDADMREIGARFAAIARDLTSFVRAIADEVVWLGRPQATLAAE